MPGSATPIVGTLAIDLARVLRTTVVVLDGVCLSPDDPRLAALLREGRAAEVALDVTDAVHVVADRVLRVGLRLAERGPHAAVTLLGGLQRVLNQFPEAA